MIEKIKKGFLEKKKEIIEKIKQPKKGEAEQSYLIGLKTMEVSMGIVGATLNTVQHILGGVSEIIGEVKDNFISAHNMFGGMNDKMDGVIGVKGNKATAEVAFIGGIKDAIDEMNNAGKKWMDDMKEKIGDGAKKVDGFLEKLEKELKKKQKEMKEMLDKLTGDAEKILKQFLNDVEETQNQIMKKMEKASKEGKKQLTEMLEEVKEIQDEIAKEMKKVAESTDKKITDAANEAINNAEKRLEEIRKKLEH